MDGERKIARPSNAPPGSGVKASRIWMQLLPLLVLVAVLGALGLWFGVVLPAFLEHARLSGLRHTWPLGALVTLTADPWAYLAGAFIVPALPVVRVRTRVGSVILCVAYAGAGGLIGFLGFLALWLGTATGLSNV